MMVVTNMKYVLCWKYFYPLLKHILSFAAIHFYTVLQHISIQCWNTFLSFAATYFYPLLKHISIHCWNIFLSFDQTYFYAVLQHISMLGCNIFQSVFLCFSAPFWNSVLFGGGGKTHWDNWKPVKCMILYTLGSYYK